MPRFPNKIVMITGAASGIGRARRFEYPGSRDIVRDRAAKTALQMARWVLRGDDAAILWERA